MSATEQNLPLTQTIAPADEAALAAAIREAYRCRTAVYPIGGGTSSGFGLLPTQPGIGLSTSAINGIVEHSVNDSVITVDAGLTMAELNRRLAAQRQWLPIEAPQPSRATLGGIVAANAFGPRRYTYGTIRDYLIAIRAVDGRGEVIASGNGAVKDPEGYNIPRLLAGSLGTLGVITQMTFMVRPIPKASAVVLCDVSELEGAEFLLAALSRSKTFPAAVELLAGRQRAACPLPPLPRDSVARLLVGFDGSPAEVDWMVRRVCDEWRSSGATAITTICGSGVDSVWKWLSDISAHIRIDVLPSTVVRIVEELVECIPNVGVQVHAGNGVVLVEWPADEPRFAERIRQSIRPMVSAAGGNLTILDTLESTSLSLTDIWGPQREFTAAMHAIQQRFDPEGIMNPGRFAFGSP